MRTVAEQPWGAGTDTPKFDEIGRTNYVAVFETNGHFYSGDVQCIFDELSGLVIPIEGAEGEGHAVTKVLYSQPAGFVYVGVATTNPRDLYQAMLEEGRILPGQIALIGVVPYSGEGDEFCNNRVLDVLGYSPMVVPRSEEDVRWTIETYKELGCDTVDIGAEEWREVIGNCMFNVGVTELGEGIEHVLHSVDGHIEGGDVDAAAEELLNSEVRPFALRAMLYLALVQDLENYLGEE